ncbi:MAG: type II toxin-antitoxin system RelE/ParE family toxin [Chitinophagaceae bacterium]|nr:MAG: type II toxin-antitoxin system RelE/ParE family toxin [Chitinophagaceae bacterium]
MFTCRKIAENPEIGKNYNEIGSSILGYLFKKHIIFYTIKNPDEIQIIRILHSSMDLKNRIAE